MQMEDKKKHLEIEKNISNEQAEMWKKENEYYFNKEHEINEIVIIKINQISNKNKNNAEFLKKQMEDRKKEESKKMNVSEFLLNKKLLETMRKPF